MLLKKLWSRLFGVEPVGITCHTCERFVLKDSTVTVNGSVECFRCIADRALADLGPLPDDRIELTPKGRKFVKKIGKKTAKKAAPKKKSPVKKATKKKTVRKAR